MNTERFEASLAFVLKWEGSIFTNDPVDHGGATRFGVIQREYDAFRRRRGQPTRSVNFISMDEVRDIYRREYWEAVQGDRLPVPLDIVTFDTGVLMGVGRAVRLLQQSLNVGVDGDIGPETRRALAAANPQAVAGRFTTLREARLRAIVARDPPQERFLRGWLNRLNDLRRTIAQPGPHALLDESIAATDPEDVETLSPEADVAAGRAVADLPEDFPDESGVEAKQPRGVLLETTGVGSFIESASSLLEFSNHPRYVVDVARCDQEVLRVLIGPSLSDVFELPVAAVETLTPFAFLGGDPSKVIAAVVFRPEFRSLAALLSRLGDASSVSGAGRGLAQEFTSPIFAAQGVPAFGEAGPDDDPANPAPSELNEEAGLDIATARVLANFGAIEPGTNQPPLAAAEILAEDFRLESARDFQGRTMALDVTLARTFLNSCMTSSPRVRYGLGAKVPFHGAVPGKNFKKVDCSGFVREAIWRATAPHLNFRDGSVVQHEWIRAQGFTRSTPDAALLRDGAVRIAFLRPQDSSSGIGHVALVHNAQTLESHGSFGPNSRAWTKTGWQAKAVTYFLTAPTG
jgi:lysozyme family protein